MQEVVLEPASVADAASIAAMSRDLVEHGLGWRWTPRAVARQVLRDDAEVVLARSDGAIVGFCIAHFSEDDAHLILCAVAIQHRRRGIGRELLAWQMKMAQVAGIRRLWLEVRAANTEAQAFYVRHGFVPVRRLPGYYRGVEDALEMTRDLVQIAVD